MEKSSRNHSKLGISMYMQSKQENNMQRHRYVTTLLHLTVAWVSELISGKCGEPSAPVNGALLCANVGRAGDEQMVYCKPVCLSVCCLALQLCKCNKIYNTIYIGLIYRLDNMLGTTFRITNLSTLNDIIVFGRFAVHEVYTDGVEGS